MLFAALSRPESFKASKCIGWWDSEPWLGGVVRAIQSFGELTPRRESRGEERLKLVLNMNINSIEHGTQQRAEFEKAFIRDVSGALGCDPRRLQIIAVTAGSVVVSFSLGIGGPGEASPASLKRKLGGLVEDRRSELYNGAVTCMVDEQRSSRALTGASSLWADLNSTVCVCVCVRVCPERCWRGCQGWESASRRPSLRPYEPHTPPGPDGLARAPPWSSSIHPDFRWGRITWSGSPRCWPTEQQRTPRCGVCCEPLWQ